MQTNYNILPDTALSSYPVSPVWVYAEYKTVHNGKIVSLFVDNCTVAICSKRGIYCVYLLA